MAFFPHRFHPKHGWLPWQQNCDVWILLDYYIISPPPNMCAKFDHDILVFG